MAYVCCNDIVSRFTGRQSCHRWTFRTDQPWWWDHHKNKLGCKSKSL